MKIEDLKNDGGPYGLYNQDGGLVECFDSVESAIKHLVAHWHEDDRPGAYTIRLLWETVCTVCPVGSDKLICVRDNGDTMTWEQIHYVSSMVRVGIGDGERVDHTFAINNGVEYRFKL